MSSAFALVAAITWRLSFGGWPLRVGSGSFEVWYLEMLLGVVNWALASIFVSAFAQWPVMFIEGYRSKQTKPA